MIIDDKDFWSQYTDVDDLKYKLILVDPEIKSLHRRGEMEALQKVWYRNTFYHLKHILKGIELHHDEIVIDYGCGIGRMAKAMINFCHKVIGMDISPIMVEEGKKYCEGINNIDLTCIAKGEIQREAASIDFIYSILTLQHIHDLEQLTQTLSLFYRLLKPGSCARYQFRTYATESIRYATNFDGLTMTVSEMGDLARELGFIVISTDDGLGEDCWGWLTVQRPAADGAKVL